MPCVACFLCLIGTHLLVPSLEGVQGNGHDVEHHTSELFSQGKHTYVVPIAQSIRRGDDRHL
jgi:hypothetical protein